MSNIPISDDLASAFANADSSVRAILVQNDSGFLKLVDTAPPSSPDALDKDDFAPTLGKLFGKDPQRSGYALYRLDSQSAAGDWEWLCCSFQPDGAKIKEKMQYAITRSSLMAGLTERKFLETIFGASPQDFHWPAKLRNSRKHDYQNPQLKATGKSAADAAGTGVGGARRNFGSAKLPAAHDDAKAVEVEKSNVEERPPLVPETEQATVSSISVPKNVSHQSGSATEKAPVPIQDQREDQKQDSSQQLVSEDLTAQEANEEQFTSETKAPEEPSTPAVAADSSAALSQPTLPNEPSSTDHEEANSIIGDLDATRAPTERPVEAAEPSDDQPGLPATLDEHHKKDTTIETASSKREDLGSGSSASLLTEKEEELARLRKAQASERASSHSTVTGSQAGGPQMGFKWADGVEEAIRSLASTASGTSETNLVILSIDLRNELVELESPPRFVPPGELAGALSNTDPTIAFYRVDELGSMSSGESVIAMLYCCPASSGVKARMVYSSNVLTVLSHVKTFSGMRIVKKLEASDRSELSHKHVTEEIEAVLSQERHKFAGTDLHGGGDTISKSEPAGFSRPKKAGSGSKR